MKKLYKNISLFLLPILLLLIFLPVDKRLKYKGLEGDCLSHGTWMYQRVFENKKPVDIVFLGSSHTISAVDDALIEAKLSERKLHVLNLGYCRLGRNLHYALLKELLRKKTPSYLILEVREDEDRYSHPIFPYLADSKDVLWPKFFFNRDLLDDAYTHLSYKVELSQDFLYHSSKLNSVDQDDFGQGTTNDTTDLKLMQEAKAKRSIPKEELSEFQNNFYLKYPRSYLKEIAFLCEANNIALHFLYLPSYGSYLDKPKEFDTYKKYGEVLLPPQEIFNDTNHWYDINHLNPAGTNALSIWLFKEIQNTIIFDQK